MDADLLAQDEGSELKGSSIIAAIKASGIKFILSVPDIVTSGGLLRPIARDASFKLIRVRGAFLLRQARAHADPAHGLSRFHQRDPRRRGRVSPADRHDDRASATRSRDDPEKLAALRRAHHRADPRAQRHPPPPAPPPARHLEDSPTD